MRCGHCAKEGATCFGSYESDTHAYACDDCCGHGNEDGHCAPIGEPEETCCMELLDTLTKLKTLRQNIIEHLNAAKETKARLIVEGLWPKT
jgi:hypothetical protein